MSLSNNTDTNLVKLSLRTVEEKDCRLLWKWRNEYETRKWFFEPEYVPYDEHQNWFSKKLHDPKTKILIILAEERREIGQVRLELSDDKSAEVDISIVSNERNKGYGAQALSLACQYAWEKLNVARLIAHIKEGNQASINAFTKAGFISSGLVEFKGHKALEMVWSWQ